jgi:quercetin dioxygenase-like cupin family protein
MEVSATLAPEPGSTKQLLKRYRDRFLVRHLCVKIRQKRLKTWAFEGNRMKDFPDFMKSSGNRISTKSQSAGVRGWVYDGVDDSQMAYWICEVDGESAEHVHDYDEYFTVVQGKYTLIIDGQRIGIRKGGEYFIQKNTPHAGEFTAGTRTIHCFGGKRAERARSVSTSHIKKRILVTDRGGGEI